MSATLLPTPPTEPAGTLAWVGRHLADLYSGSLEASPAIRGGQRAADAALAAYDVAGYAASRNEVWPPERRGASRLSPYIRHGLLPLPRVWAAVEGGPARDVSKFRDELLWQEYARHLYARLGDATAQPLRYRSEPGDAAGGPPPAAMACVDFAAGELEGDGWLVNQTRMWLASHWTVRERRDWSEGEDWFFTHLLDGSRAANRLGWQWTTGMATGKPYGFSRWQVEKRAPGMCDSCELAQACPIEQWPERVELQRFEPDSRLRSDPSPEATAGPRRPEVVGRPEAVWLTAESLGDQDPALAAHPGVPAVFVFDQRLLARLHLSAKRLVFLAECLGDLAQRRTVEVHRGDPVSVLSGRAMAATFTPVPGWRRRAARIDLAATYPWPWLRRPHAGSVASFSAWRKALGTTGRR